MKTETTEWDVPRLLQSISYPEMKVFTTGHHTEDRFCGVLLGDEIKYKETFVKDCWEVAK